MTYGQFVSRYSVCSVRIIYLAGYKSPNMHLKLKDTPFEKLPFSIKRILLAMAVNLHYIYVNSTTKIKDDPYWFMDKVHATNFRINSPKVYSLFTFNTRNTYKANIERDLQLRKAICLYLYTGILLFISGYDEGATSSQHERNMLPPDTNATRPT